MVLRKEYATRQSKARKIISILKDYFGDLNEEWTCLDVGCGSGDITIELSRHFKTTIGLETKFGTFRKSSPSQNSIGLFYLQADGLRIPVPDESVEITICAQVYEHVIDPQALIQEIWRILKPHGVCFFSGPNKWAIMEEHYWLPFLSWIPGPITNLYMRAFKRGTIYDIKPMGYWALRTLVKRFKIIDYSTKMIKNPDKYSMSDFSRASEMIRHIPEPILRVLRPFFPNFNWILVKQ